MPDDTPESKPPKIRDALRRTADAWHTQSYAALLGATALISISLAGPASTPAAAQQPAQKPNILFIMGDDIGIMQTSIYHRGLRRVARRAAPTSSPGNCRSAPV